MVLVFQNDSYLLIKGFLFILKKNNAAKVSVSEVLNALDMPGAVRDIKRFNYVCRVCVFVSIMQLYIQKKGSFSHFEISK